MRAGCVRREELTAADGGLESLAAVGEEAAVAAPRYRVRFGESRGGELAAISRFSDLAIQRSSDPAIQRLTRVSCLTGFPALWILVVGIWLAKRSALLAVGERAFEGGALTLCWGIRRNGSRQNIPPPAVGWTRRGFDGGFVCCRALIE